MFSFAAGAVRRLNEAGLPVFVVTNQSGVGRGYFPESLVQTVHEIMTRELSNADAHLDAVYHCPHTSADACECRKPKPGLFHQIAERYGVSLQAVPAIGDSARDIEAAKTGGATPVGVASGRASTGELRDAGAALVLPDLTDPAPLIDLLTGRP